MRVTEEQYQGLLQRPGFRKPSEGEDYQEMIKPTKRSKQPEFEEQAALFRMAEKASLKYPELELLNGSLNGVRLNIGQAVKAKKGGMKAGYPDVFLPVPRGKWHGLYIEMKVKGGRVRPEQKKWMQRLAEQGYYCTVCWSAVEAFDGIVAYLES